MKTEEVASKKHWYVYILKCNDGTFYTGIALDVHKRLGQHNSGRGARYTKTRRPAKLVYTQQCDDRREAMLREIELKKWKRERKISLIRDCSS